MEQTEHCMPKLGEGQEAKEECRGIKTGGIAKAISRANCPQTSRLSGDIKKISKKIKKNLDSLFLLIGICEIGFSSWDGGICFSESGFCFLRFGFCSFSTDPKLPERSGMLSTSHDNYRTKQTATRGGERIRYARLHSAIRRQQRRDPLDGTDTRPPLPSLLRGED